MLVLVIVVVLGAGVVVIGVGRVGVSIFIGTLVSVLELRGVVFICVCVRVCQYQDVCWSRSSLDCLIMVWFLSKPAPFRFVSSSDTRLQYRRRTVLTSWLS